MDKLKKAVIITRADGTEIEYASQSEAARGEKLVYQSIISKMCRGKQKDHMGIKARFKNVSDDLRSQPVSST